MNYLKVILIVCVISCVCSGCTIILGSESEESPYYDHDLRFDREMPTPILISDDRTFFLC